MAEREFRTAERLKGSSRLTGNAFTARRPHFGKKLATKKAAGTARHRSAYETKRTERHSRSDALSPEVCACGLRVIGRSQQDYVLYGQPPLYADLIYNEMLLMTAATVCIRDFDFLADAESEEKNYARRRAGDASGR